MKVNFEEINMIIEKKGKCVVCGKYCTIREKFYQTLNPFNKNKEDNTKDSQEIQKELLEEVKEWRLKPIKHRKCK